MLEKILKIGGLCLLGVGGLALLLIPGIGWVSGTAALIMVATGAGACIGAAWGTQSYIQSENDKKLEKELMDIELRLALMEERNYRLDNQINLTKAQLNTTAQLKTALDQSTDKQRKTIIDQDDTIDRLEKTVQEKTRECTQLKILLRENDIDINQEANHDETSSNMLSLRKN